MQIHQIGLFSGQRWCAEKSRACNFFYSLCPKAAISKMCVSPFDWHHVCFFTFLCSASFLSCIHFNCLAALKDFRLSICFNYENLLDCRRDWCKFHSIRKRYNPGYFFSATWGSLIELFFRKEVISWGNNDSNFGVLYILRQLGWMFLGFGQFEMFVGLEKF